jgi:aminoglycoside phosphotransferase
MMNVNWNYRRYGESERAGASASVVSSDPRFRQLDEFHEERLVLSHLGEALKLSGAPARCEILNVWYIPHKSFRVIYRLGTGTTEAHDLVLLVEFHPPGESLHRYRDALAGARDKRAVVHLAGWEAVAWLFPEDPTLPWLPAMIDTARIARRLGWPADYLEDADRIRWDLMGYLPGERCAIRYRLRDRAVVGKMYRGGAAAECHRIMVRLWAAPQRRFRMARPIGLDEDLGVHWEEYVSGQHIEARFSEIALEPLMEGVIRGLASLHRLPLHDLMPQGVEQVVDRLDRKVMPRIRAALSPLAPALDAFRATLIRKAGSLPARPQTTIHGDFHTANMLMDAGELVVIDMDRLALGDPAYDLALFGSRLLLIALHRDERLGEVADLVSSLPKAYEAEAGHAIPEPTFAWYLAALFVGRQIKTCIRHRAPALGRLAPALLAWAHETLERGRFDRSIVEGTS